jgi:hypothetical protein
VNGVTLKGDPEAVDQLIARVLRQAHDTAEVMHAPNEARAILNVAHLFADELTHANPHFDRLGFIREATQGQSWPQTARWRPRRRLEPIGSAKAVADVRMIGLSSHLYSSHAYAIALRLRRGRDALAPRALNEMIPPRQVLKQETPTVVQRANNSRTATARTCGAWPWRRSSRRLPSMCDWRATSAIGLALRSRL